MARPNTSSSEMGLPLGVSKCRLVQHPRDVEPDGGFGEAAAGAAAVAGAEGDVGRAGQRGRHGAVLLGQETLGDELVGRVPVARVVVDGVDVAQYLRSRRDQIAADFGVLGCLVGQTQRANGAVAHGFGQAGKGVRQTGAVFHRGQSIMADGAIQLFVNFGLDFGAVGQEQQEPVDGLGRGVGTRYQQVHAQIPGHFLGNFSCILPGEHDFDQAGRDGQVESGTVSGVLYQGTDDGPSDFRLADGFLEGAVGQEFKPRDVVGQVGGGGAGEYPVDIAQESFPLLQKFLGYVFLLPEDTAEHEG